MNNIAGHLNRIRQLIREAELQYHRILHSVTLLAVSKAQHVENIVAAIHAEQRIFGENYLQEALEKIAALRKYQVEWHFIGVIQANKTREIAENFSWVHSVSRLSVAERLQNQRPKDLPPLNICIQVNISEEKNKAGIKLSELAELALAITQYDRLRLRGLMTIPAFNSNFDKQLKNYQQLAQAQQALIGRGLLLDTLSMGMTQDMFAAIAAGSTLVRIGTGIFGQRGQR